MECPLEGCAISLSLYLYLSLSLSLNIYICLFSSALVAQTHTVWCSCFLSNSSHRTGVLLHNTIVQALQKELAEGALANEGLGANVARLAGESAKLQGDRDAEKGNVKVREAKMKEAEGTAAADDLEEDEVAMVEEGDEAGEEDEVVMEEEKDTDNDNAEEIVVEYNHNDYADLIGEQGSNHWVEGSDNPRRNHVVPYNMKHILHPSVCSVVQCSLV